MATAPDDRRILRDTQVNRDHLENAAEHWSELQAECLRRGFYGIASVVLNIQDGTIQSVESRLFKTSRT